MTVASGKSRSTSVSTASSCSSRAPELATRTGSTTSGTGCSSRKSTTASISGAEKSIPVLAASTPRSSKTASSCARTKSGGTSCTAVTPVVFCAVSATIALIPWQPAAAKAFRSAWIPAPPPESDPAIVKQRGINLLPSPVLTGSGSTGVISAHLGTPVSQGYRETYGRRERASPCPDRSGLRCGTPALSRGARPTDPPGMAERGWPDRDPRRRPRHARAHRRESGRGDRPDRGRQANSRTRAHRARGGQQRGERGTSPRRRRDAARRPRHDTVERSQRPARDAGRHAAHALHRPRLARMALSAVTWDDLLEGGELAHVETLPAADPRVASLPDDLDPGLREALPFDGLYTHQRDAWDIAARGEHLILATGTASGKSLAFNLPVLDAIAREPKNRALYLYPTKALAQDQARALAELHAPNERAAIYDGDTESERRWQIRTWANLVLTNPDMLHVGVLPHHDRWGDVLHNLRYIVVDEAHVYRGVFGSHVGNVLRRLRRLAGVYGADPQLLLASATIANPGELASSLAGIDAKVVGEDG